MILIGLGSNLSSAAGSPRQTLHAALAELEQRGISVQEISPFYQTQAWPDPSDPAFVNAVARLETALSPGVLLEVLHAVEAVFGRRRHATNAPRTLDLDLLDYDGRIEAGPPVLPHPRLTGRGFVLRPLADIAPHWVHPGSGHGISQLLDRVDCVGMVKLD